MSSPRYSIQMLVFIREVISSAPLHNFMMLYTAEDAVRCTQRFNYMSTAYPLARKELREKINASLKTIAAAELHGVSYEPVPDLVKLICVAVLKR